MPCKPIPKGVKPLASLPKGFIATLPNIDKIPLPVGLAKDAYERYQELEAMSPEEREDLRIKGEEFAFGDLA